LRNCSDRKCAKNTSMPMASIVMDIRDLQILLAGLYLTR
jgi:hypothetical protein